LKDNVVIIGLGYVGLPIAIAAANSGYSVIGIDLNNEKVGKINSGQSPIEGIEDFEILNLVKRGIFKAESDYSNIKHAEIILICVPTPLSIDNKPDLSFLESSAKSISKFLTKGSLIILESTVAPGTTRDFLVPIINRNSGLEVDTVDIVFSPERIDPLNKNWNLKNTPKIVAGLTPESTHRAKVFYSKFVDNLVECEVLEVAETAKLLENSFRLVNISFINELSIFCQKLNIEINDVINAAATKPYGFMAFYPGVGIGGHCIPVDPLYLSDTAMRLGTPNQFIDLAAQVNRDMPMYFVRRAEEKLGGLKGKKVLVIGVSYKPNVSDVRETPVEALITGLRGEGAHVSWHDDLVNNWNKEKSVAISSKYDLAILATPHDYLDLTKLGHVPILDTRKST